MLVLDQLDADGKPTGGYLIAVDAVGAGRGRDGPGAGRGQRRAADPGRRDLPIRSVVVGIVDELG